MTNKEKILIKEIKDELLKHYVIIGTGNPNEDIVFKNIHLQTTQPFKIIKYESK